MEKDHRLRIKMLSEEMGLDKNAAHRILTNIWHMRKICAQPVTKHLSVEEKEKGLEICQDLLASLIIEPNFFNNKMNHSCLSMIPRTNCKMRNGA